MQGDSIDPNSPMTSARAYAPGRILLSEPKIARIPRIRTILRSAGWEPHRKTPLPDDALAVPMAAPTASAQTGKVAWIGEAFIPTQPCARTTPLPPAGAIIDTRGSIHDPVQPSDLEEILQHAPLDDSAVLGRARDAAEWLRMLKLCKYPALSAQFSPQNEPYVLILDQPEGDVGLPDGAQATSLFLEMLVLAHEAHPHAKIVVFSPNRDAKGAIKGHFDGADASPSVTIYTDPANPWDMLELATAVYTIASPIGFDAILAGHRPRVFGQPWYAGWGLTDDEFPIHRRTRHLTRAQLVAGALIHYPVWYDAQRKCRCTLEDAIALAEARQRSAVRDAGGYVASNILLWKRPFMRRYFGANGIVFSNAPTVIARETARGRTHVAWGTWQPNDAPEPSARIEDGFLRSRGLGAALVPPMSLICDDQGIYFDPTRPLTA